MVPARTSGKTRRGGWGGRGLGWWWGRGLGWWWGRLGGRVGGWGWVGGVRTFSRPTQWSSQDRLLHSTVLLK